MVLVAGAIDRATLVQKISRLIPEGLDFFLTFRASTLKPSLCLGAIGGQPRLPNTIKDVEEAEESFRKDGELDGSSFEVGHYDLIVGSRDLAGAKAPDTERLTLILYNFLFNNLSFFNYVEDTMYEKINNLEFESLHSTTSNYDAFVEMITAQFAVTAEILRVNDDEGPIMSLCKDTHFTRQSCEEIRGYILHALDKAQVIEATIQHPDSAENQASPEQGYRYIFPIRSKSKGITQTNEFMIVEGPDRSRLSVLSIFSINLCVDEYAYVRVRLGQRRCLYWQTTYITDLIESVDNTAIDQGERFRVYMGELAQMVVASTQGHSFAYLSYDASEEALARSVATFKPMTEESDGDGVGLEPVFLRDSRHHISARLFERQSDGGERDIYLSSIRNRKEWAGFGLESVRCRRNELIEEGKARGSPTQSEAAFIIHDQGMPVGVICIECPYRDGLANDLDFLRQVASNASIYRSFLFRMGDQRWLRGNLKLQDVAHDLKKLNLVVTNRDVYLRLAQITGDLSVEAEGDAYEPDGRTFVQRIDHVVLEEAGGEPLLEDMGQPVKVFNPIRHDIPHSIQLAAVHIIRILLRNRLHEPKDGVRATPSPISVVSRDKHAGVRNALLIRATLNMNLPESEIQDAFRRPIRRADREHVGLYMLGVLVRAWGGRLDFDRRPGVVARKLVICIPFGRSAGGSANDSDTNSGTLV